MLTCICNQTFDSQKEFENHYSSCQQVRNYLASLSLPTNYVSRQRLLDKLLKRGFYLESAIEGRDYIICPYCPQELNRYKTLSTQHFRIHNKTVDQVKKEFPDIQLSRDLSLDIRKATNKKKFGVEFVGQLEENRQKIKARDSHFYKERQEKIEQTCLSKYGVKNPMLTEEVKQNQVKTIFNKYGVQNVMELDSIREKIKQTFLERYGIDHPAKLRDISKLPPFNRKRFRDQLRKKISDGELFKIDDIISREERHNDIYQKLDDREKGEFLKKLFFYYREIGFPHNQYNNKLFLQTISKIKKLKDNQVNQILAPKINNDLFQYFMPHFWECNSKGNPIPVNYWEDDEKLRKLIKSRLKYAGIVSDESMRRGIKINCKTPTNFNAGIMKLLVDRYGKEDSVIYDFCAGFGGRLVGAACSLKTKEYIGIDISENTVKGLLGLRKWLYDNKVIERYRTKITIKKQNSLKYLPTKEVDLIITSPPYFDKEFYSDDEGQSITQFPEYEEWFNDYLLKSVRLAASHLKEKGYFIISLSNIKGYSIYNDFRNNYKDLKLIDELEIQYPQIFQKEFVEKILVYQTV